MKKREMTPRKIFWYTIVGVAALAFLHLGAGFAIWNFDWKLFLSSILYWQITAPLGISLCYHRYYNHRSFECTRMLKCVLLFLGCLCGQLGPMRWVRVHRAHHANAETSEDPHSPRHGFWFSHFGWLLQLKRRSQLPQLHIWPADLLNDKDCVFFEKAYPWIQILSVIIFYLIAGWEGVLWLWFFRTCLTLHSIWSINSFGHTFGYRNFECNDDSTNLRIYALFAGGEPLHNNHHAHSSSARFSVKTNEFDLSWFYLKLFIKLGWVWNVKVYEPLTQKMELQFVKAGVSVK